MTVEKESLSALAFRSNITGLKGLREIKGQTETGINMMNLNTRKESKIEKA